MAVDCTTAGAMMEEIDKVIEHFVRDKNGRQLLKDIWNVIQAWDDLHDGDQNKQAAAAMRIANIDIPMNPLYQAFATPLQMQQMYLKWCASNAFEEAKLRDQLPKSYMLRAEYYQLIVNMICLLEGVEIAALKAPDVWVCYGESYQDYENEICPIPPLDSLGAG